MKRLTEPWIEFKGTKNTALGVELLSMPQRPRPKAIGEYAEIAGRGQVWIPGAETPLYEPVTLSCTLVVERPDLYIDQVYAWLTGEGLLRLGDDPNRAYYARVVKEMSCKPKSSRMTALELQPKFDCDPYRYVYPEPAAIIASNGSTIANPGTAPSEPRITVTGSGDITLTIAGQLVELHGVSGGRVIDSRMRDVYESDGLTLCNDKAVIEGDAFPTLPPCNSAITWTGSVTAVQILPRWRYL